MNKNIIIYSIILIVIVIVILYINNKNTNTNTNIITIINTNENDDNYINNDNINDIYDITNNITYNNIEWVENVLMTHIIISRYREPDISNILKPLINKHNVKVFIYNKGDDMPLGIPSHAINVKIIQVPNIGWDSYGYITHVINNYNNLPDYIFSIHASSEYLIHKFKLYLTFIYLSKDIAKYSGYKYYYGGDILKVPLNFRIFNHVSASKINRINNKFEEASIYPLHKWLLSKINNIPSNAIIENDYMLANYFGMFIVNKNSILSYPKSFYSNILDEISVWQSEVNHYLERSWYVFYS